MTRQTNGVTARRSAVHTNDSTEKQGGFFEDISFAQVGAGSLAAVTSMLLSSQIGVTGSVIGVAVGAAVSTLCTQVYKKFLSNSADRLRGLHSDDETADDAYADQATAALQHGAHSGYSASTSSAQAFDQASTTRTMQSVYQDAQPTAYIHPVRRSDARNGQTPRLGNDAVISTKALNARAQSKRKTKVQRGVLVVSVVSALAAVAICAGVINLTTAGQGVGTKTDPIIATDTSAASSTSASSSAPANGAPSQATTSDKDSSDQTGAAAAATSSDSSTASTTGTTGSTTDTTGTSSGTASGSQSTAGTSTGSTSSSGNTSTTNSGSTSTTGTTGSTTGTTTGTSGTTTANTAA